MHSCGTGVWKTKFNVTSDWCLNEMVVVLDIILLENAGRRCVLSPLDVHCVCINVSPAVILNHRPYRDTCTVSVYGGQNTSSHVFKQKDIKDNRLSIMMSHIYPKIYNITLSLHQFLSVAHILWYSLTTLPRKGQNTYWSGLLATSLGVHCHFGVSVRVEPLEAMVIEIKRLFIACPLNFKRFKHFQSFNHYKKAYLLVY